MHGLIGERLLKRFFGGILHRPTSARTDAEATLETDNDPAATTGPDAPQPEQVKGQQKSGDSERTKQVTDLRD